MSASESQAAAQQGLRQYLQQRLDAGEKVAYPALPRRDSAPAPAARHGAVTPDASVSGTSTLDASVSGTSTLDASVSGTSTPDASVSGTTTPGTSTPGTSTPGASTPGTSTPDTLESVAAQIRACTRCRLHTTRTHAVPGVGPANAALLFVGEGPGADEDASGEPFVGRAGQLLTRIIEAVKLRRQDVFITNIVKCRPPQNRDPEPDEIAACRPFLERQIELLAPRVICTLGRHAAKELLGAPDSMARLRTGRHRYGQIPVFPTYHPAALLRNPQWKRPVWEDIQKVRRAYDGADE